jgi:hypothetical protein
MDEVLTEVDRIVVPTPLFQELFTVIRSEYK